MCDASCGHDPGFLSFHHVVWTSPYASSYDFFVSCRHVSPSLLLLSCASYASSLSLMSQNSQLEVFSIAQPYSIKHSKHCRAVSTHSTLQVSLPFWNSSQSYTWGPHEPISTG